MKRLSLAIAGVLSLTACQSTQWAGEKLSPRSATKQQQVASVEEGLARFTLNAGVKNASVTQQPTSSNGPASELSPQQQADLWDRIRMQLSLQVPDNEQVQTHIEWFKSHPTYLDQISQQAAPFLYLIIEMIEARNLPVELALVPIVESAYDTFAYSHGSASGLWQFIPSTATSYGLEINWWYDGRRDVVAATETALGYLERLHQTFDGDWLMALAAYNAGQGRVARLIRGAENAGKPSDFWSLDLPRETQNYVPKILALAALLADSDAHGVSWRYIANQPVTTVVELDNQIDLAQAADMAGMSLRELHRYNSGYNRWATAPEGPHRLLLPMPNAEQFSQQLAQTAPQDLMNWQRHQVQSGESLSRIAQRYGTTTRAIQQANNLDDHLIRQGDHLVIPVSSRSLDEYTLSANQRRNATQNQRRGNHRINHEVARGDTLWDLSRTYGVPIRSLASWNNMAPGDVLRPGQTLTIWRQERPGQATDDAVIRAVQYNVRSGDSLDRIASRFSVSIADIERWNKISRQRYLQPGQKLTLYVDVTRVNI